MRPAQTASRRATVSRIRARISRNTVMGPLGVSLIEFHAHSSTTSLSHPGPPASMVVTHQQAGRRYGITRNIAGMPRRRPRRARVAAMRTLVGA